MKKKTLMQKAIDHIDGQIANLEMAKTILLEAQAQAEAKKKATKATKPRVRAGAKAAAETQPNGQEA